MTLSQPLGAWTTKSPYVQRQFYYHPPTDTIIHNDGNTLHKYARTTGQATLYSRSSTLAQLPPD
eukprot:1101207-Ditylum_brightwellii.AAC.1